jgi:hypothetical protein
VHVLSGNKQVALAAGSGEIAIGLTDTDDAMGEIDAGSPVSIIYPDRAAAGLGTLFIPNVLAIIKGAQDGRTQDHLLPRRPEPARSRRREVTAAGRIGLWSKADAQSYFDDLTASE